MKLALATLTGWLLISIGVCGVLLNGFLILFLLLNLSSFHPQKILYLNLALSDFLFALLGCTLRGPGILFPGIWENDIVCKMAPYLVSYLSKANLLAITPLTTSILLITVWGHEACTRLRMTLLSTFSWITPFLFLITFSIDGLLYPSHWYVTFSPHIGRCDFNGTSHHIYSKIQGPLFFMVPMVYCGALYLFITLLARRHAVPGLRRIVVRGLTVCFFFCITWLPFYIATFHVATIPSGLYIASYAMFYVSVIVNPLVYTVTSQFFCIRFRRSVKGCWGRVKGEREVAEVHVAQPYLNKGAEENDDLSRLGGLGGGEDMESSHESGTHCTG